MKNETRRSQLMWRAIRRPYIFSYCVILSCVWYALSIKLSLSPAAQNDGRRIILLASILLWDVLYFFSMIYFLTISKCLLTASKRRWKYTQIGEEKAFTSLTTTVHFCTVYARHEGKIYLTENRSEEKSSFYISRAIEYTNKFILLLSRKPVFLLLDWTRSYLMTRWWALYT